ncbi:PIN domain-containing protein [Armatimonas sp.]|uniref:PIN/TRAM domain-containing protein n=1 Tax=Armatimonas sp. TaxID=1872638 RepID=UPI00286CFDDC|nr:PIN domain-containing protein [Armatimonas sp.]
MNNKIWRLTFTAILTGLAIGVGLYASNLVFDNLRSQNVLADNQRWIYWLVFGLSSVIFGFALGRFIFRKIESLGDQMRNMSARDKIAIGLGLALGIFLTVAISVVIFQASGKNTPMAVAIVLLTGVILSYLTTAAALSMREELHFYMPSSPKEDVEETLPPAVFKILDTNVIIDGRIADIARAGFVEGTIYIPGFVLDELQHIADSSDGLKRARGRRGLDILNQMQKELTLVVRSYDKMAPEKEEVDSRLVKLAKALNGSLVTNDFNLNKVAELQGVPVLNINELANALKPIVLPGEEMRVAVVKEGREQHQGIGYLDDGTMIVIEGGRKALGETADVIVSSLLQTTAGKMIFAHMREDDGGTDYDRNIRSYTRGPRTPTRTHRS